jgi:hypothetical protein
MPVGSALLRTLAGGALVAAVVGLVGCGHSTSAPARPSNPKVSRKAKGSCSVITRPEAADALGHAVEPAVKGRASVEGGVACVFLGSGVSPATNPDVPVSDSVRVVLVRGARAEPFFEHYRHKVSARPVAGLGDQAYYDGYASLSVLKGNAYARIAVIGGQDTLGAEKKLAAAALSRM